VTRRPATSSCGEVVDGAAISTSHGGLETSLGGPHRAHRRHELVAGRRDVDYDSDSDSDRNATSNIDECSLILSSRSLLTFVSFFERVDSCGFDDQDDFHHQRAPRRHRQFDYDRLDLGPPIGHGSTRRKQRSVGGVMNPERFSSSPVRPS
jgi:hypothetical protein